MPDQVRNDTRHPHYREKVPADDPRYKALVAEPTMAAVDAMPPDWRTAVHDLGYVDTYRAWRLGWLVAEVRAAASAAGGVFVLP